MKNILQFNTITSPIAFGLKRCIDLCFSTILLIMFSPLFIIIALAIKLDSPGPVFFRQMRIGLCTPVSSRLFMMIKFRTMVVDAEKNSGPVWATRNDARITATGAFLRKTRLDEIPQLFNVLLGEMSLIGPRPERPGFYDKLENEIPYFAERTYGVLPGITGLAQVNQGYDTCVEDVRTKLGFDLCYALSLRNAFTWMRMDFYIAWKTIAVMITGRGQ